MTIMSHFVCAVGDNTMIQRSDTRSHHHKWAEINWGGYWLKSAYTSYCFIWLFLFLVNWKKYRNVRILWMVCKHIIINILFSSCRCVIKRMAALTIVKITLNLPLLRCMLFADYSHNFHPIVMKFGKHYFLVSRQLPWKFQEKILCSLKVRPFDM